MLHAAHVKSYLGMGKLLQNGFILCGWVASFTKKEATWRIDRNEPIRRWCLHVVRSTCEKSNLRHRSKHAFAAEMVSTRRTDCYRSKHAFVNPEDNCLQRTEGKSTTKTENKRGTLCHKAHGCWSLTNALPSDNDGYVAVKLDYEYVRNRCRCLLSLRKHTLVGLRIDTTNLV
jgi:hypothetical protein